MFNKIITLLALILTFSVAYISPVNVSAATKTVKKPVAQAVVKKKVYQYTLCKDGTKSYSTGKGTCSHHKGVKEYIYG